MDTEGYREMTRCIWYIRGGCGDIYPALAILPAFLKDHSITIDEILFVVDCYYLKSPSSFEYTLLLDIFQRAGIDEFTTVPNEYSSSDDLQFDDGSDRSLFYSEEKILSTFMCGLRTSTKEYVRSLADVPVIDIIFPERIYWYSESGNHKIVYPAQPLHYETLGIQMDVAIHARAKYNAENLEHFSKVIKLVIASGRHAVIFGSPTEGLLPTSELVKDMRGKLSAEECMDMSAHADIFIGSNSVYTYHRMYTGAGYTIVYSPWCLGKPELLTRPEHLANPQYKFYDSNSDHTESLDVLKGWLYGDR